MKATPCSPPLPPRDYRGDLDREAEVFNAVHFKGDPLEYLCPATARWTLCTLAGQAHLYGSSVVAAIEEQMRPVNIHHLRIPR